MIYVIKNYDLNIMKQGQFYDFSVNYVPDILSAIERQKKPIVVLNDGDVEDFEHTKNALIAAFDKILPNKSSFEI